MGYKKHYLPSSLRTLANSLDKKARENFRRNQDLINNTTRKDILDSVQRNGVDLKLMTDKDLQEMVNVPELPSRDEIKSFLEAHIGTSISFEKVSVIIEDVFPREDSLTVLFQCSKKDISRLNENRMLSQQQGRDPSILIAIRESNPARVPVKIQGRLGESFKLIF
jgi:hypothetical protein